MNIQTIIIYTGYDKVLANMETIIQTLQAIPGAKQSLTVKYIEAQWMGLTATPTEYQLVGLALGRILQQSQQFDVFIGMLRGIPGMNLIVERLTSS